MGPAIVGLIISAAGLIISMRGCAEKDIAEAKEKMKNAETLKKDYEKVVHYLHSSSETEKYIVERKTSNGHLSWFIYDRANKAAGTEFTADGRQFRIRMFKLNSNREWKETVSDVASSTLVWTKIKGMDPALQGL